MPKVKDVMKKPVLTISGEAPVHEAAKKIAETNIRGIVVEKRTEEDVYGMIVIRDIMKIIAKGIDLKKIKVHEVMMKPVVTIGPDMELEYVARMLVNLSIARLPVIGDKGELLGIVSMMDILREATK